MPKKRPFARIAPQLDEAFQSQGFQRLRAGDSKFRQGQSAWRKQAGDTQYVCYLQLWKWGYDPWFGSSFTVNFFRGPVDFETVVSYAKVFETRILSLTDSEDRVEIARLQNDVIKKFRAPTPEEYKQVKGLPALNSQWKQYEKQRTPMTPATLEQKDVWLVFLDDADVDAWCALLKVWLPKGLGRFASLDELTGRGFSSDLLPRWCKT